MITSIALTVMLSRSSGEHSVLSGKGQSHPVTQTMPKK
jgi:hypothetical protein